MKQVKMVIYDCDGVIFDSEKANLEYYSYIFKKQPAFLYGNPLPLRGQ